MNITDEELSKLSYQELCDLGKRIATQRKITQVQEKAQGPFTSTYHIAFILKILNKDPENKWGCQGKFFGRTKTLKEENSEKAEKILLNNSYQYDLGAGWIANIEVMRVPEKEALRIRRRSKGFCGYDWMINDIMDHYYIGHDVPDKIEPVENI